MLRYLQKETLEKAGSGLEIAWITPCKVKTLEGLARVISGSDPKILQKVKSLGISASMGIAGFNAELDVSMATEFTKDLLQEEGSKTLSL